VTGITRRKPFTARCFEGRARWPDS